MSAQNAKSRSCLAYPRNRGWSGLKAAATVGRFVRARARLVGARVESAELCMDTIGLHAQFGGFAQPLRPPSPSSAKPVEPPPLGRHRGGSLRCVKKGAALRGVIAMVVGLAAATRRRRPYPSSEQRTPHQNSDSEAMAAQVSRFDPARLLSFVHADLERH